MQTKWISLKTGFTLVEVLTVVAIAAILASISIVALPTLMSAQAVTKTSSDLSQALDGARAYAMANHTYVFVGFEEVDSSATANAAGQTQANGSVGGRLGVAVVASTDGTSNYTTGAFSATNLTPISQFKFFNGVHLVSPTSLPTIAGRVTGSSVTSLATAGGSALFTWPVGSANPQYSFYTNQVIQFDQDGVGSLVTSTTSAPTTPAWLELDLSLIHGNSTASPSTTEATAIQIDGVTGSNRVFRP